MDVLLDDDELALRDELRRFLTAECTPALVRQAEKDVARHAPALWRTMGQLGWIGIALPERDGGQGLALTRLGLLFEEAGRCLAPVPLQSSLVAAHMLSRFGDDVQRTWTQRVARGEAVLSYAIQGGDGRWSADGADLRGRRAVEGWVLDGVRTCVDNFAVSDRCLVLFQGVGGSVAAALVDPRAPGITHESLVTMAKDGQERVRFEAVTVAQANIVPGGAALARMLCDLAALTMAAQLAGAARRDMEMAAEYAKMRVAFEQPIGSFQVIQHMLVDMLLAVDGVDLLTREAFWRMAQGLPASVQAAQAKSFASERCVVVARGSQQIHGGIGFMLEFDLQLWYRRICAWALRCGTPIEHRRLLAAALLDRPGQLRLGSELRL